MTPPSLLMIRPQETAQSFVDALTQALGRSVETVYSPVVAINAVTADIHLSGISYLVFTSANGVRQFSSLTFDRTVPALCVGKTTQKTATEVGLMATATGKTVSDLVLWLKANKTEQRPRILYLRGQQVAFDLLSALRKSGFQARETVVYQQIHCPLSEQAIVSIKENRVVIPVFSANSARGLLKSNALLKARHADLVCISHKVAQEFSNYPSDRIAISPTSDRAGMISSIADLL